MALAGARQKVAELERELAGGTQRPPVRRKMSAAGRRAIAAGQRKRWRNAKREARRAAQGRSS